MCSHYTYEVQTTALQPLECANTHIRCTYTCMHTHACTQAHTHMRTHTRTVCCLMELSSSLMSVVVVLLSAVPLITSLPSLSPSSSTPLLFCTCTSPLSSFLPPLLYPMLSSFLLFRTVLFSLSCAPYSCSVFFLLPFLSNSSLSAFFGLLLLFHLYFPSFCSPFFSPFFICSFHSIVLMAQMAQCHDNILSKTLVLTQSWASL